MHLNVSVFNTFARLSVRVDKEIATNLTLSINLSLHFIIKSLFCFSIRAETVKHFSVFSLRYSIFSFKLLKR